MIEVHFQLKEFAKGAHQRMLGVYLGKEILKFGEFEVLPFSIFIEKLFVGKLF